MHLIDVFRQYMGWCPAGSTSPVRKWAPPQEVNSPLPPEDGIYMEEGVVIDYGSTGASPLYLIGLVAGVTGIVLFFTFIRMASTLLAGILLWGFILSAAAAILYEDMKKASLEITPDSLVIHRVLPWDIVVPKDNIAGVEVRDTILPVPPWLLAALLFIVVPLSSGIGIYDKYLQWMSGEVPISSFFFQLGFAVSIVLFFLAIFYHARVRSYYRKTLVITTTTRKRIGIYRNDMEGPIVKMLEKLNDTDIPFHPSALQGDAVVNDMKRN
jgi:hypothetical protein